MFERFNDRARAVVVNAQEVSRVRGHNFIGTGHLLASLLEKPTELIEDVFQTLQPSLKWYLAEVYCTQEMSQNPGSPSGHIPFTPAAKKALECALREALQLGDNYIGPEHLLLGLVREGESAAASVFDKAGKTLAYLRAVIVEVRKNTKVEEKPKGRAEVEAMARWGLANNAMDRMTAAEEETVEDIEISVGLNLTNSTIYLEVTADNEDNVIVGLELEEAKGILDDLKKAIHIIEYGVELPE